MATNIATILPRVTDATELGGIHALQTSNLGRRLPHPEWTREGFLTSAYTVGFIAELHRHAPAITAEASEAVVGYALVATPEVRFLEPSLAGLFASIDAAASAGARLSRLRRGVRREDPPRHRSAARALRAHA